MATTGQYLQSLQNDMQTLKTNVANKGVAVDDNDNFTTLSVKVSQISGGGDEPELTSLTTIADYINACYDNIDTLLEKQVSQRDVYTNNAITLYTPDSACKNYVIAQRDSAYRIIWQERAYIHQNTNALITPCGLGGVNNFITNGEKFEDFHVSFTLSSNDYAGSSYVSSNYSSLEQCIQAIQSNATTYTHYTDTWYGASSNAIKYSNIPAFGTNREILTSIIKLSKNETIVQI